MNLTASVDTSLFDRAVLRYKEGLGIDLPKAVRNSARLLALDLLRLTPPKSQGQGRSAVKRDIGRAMLLLDPEKIHNAVLKTAVQDQEFDVVQAFLKNVRGAGGAFSGSRLERFSPELHQRARNRQGRVTRSQKVLVIERSAYRSYVRQVQGHVGSTKYAWGAAAQRLGASVPGWILRHAPVHGDFVEDDDKENPSVTLLNRGAGIDNLRASQVQFALNRRARAMTRDVDQILKGRASRAFN